MQIIAVITIDVVNSTKLSSSFLDNVIERLRIECSSLEKERRVSYFETFRGDSLQLIVPQPEHALRIAFILKTAVNCLTYEDKEAGLSRGNKIKADIRFSIGIGETRQISLLKMTNETPFIRSGRELDQIQKENRITGILTGNSQIDKEFKTELFLYEGISRKWTVPVAELVYYKLYGKTEQLIADELKISQSAVNQRSNSAYWKGLEILLDRYSELITDSYHE